MRSASAVRGEIARSPEEILDGAIAEDSTRRRQLMVSVSEGFHAQLTFFARLVEMKPSDLYRSLIAHGLAAL